MTAHMSLFALFTLAYLGCAATPPLTVSEDLEFLQPQKIRSLAKTTDGKHGITLFRTARYLAIDPITKAEQRMFKLVNQQLRMATKLRSELFVTIQKTDGMPRIVRIALTPDPRNAGN